MRHCYILIAGIGCLAAPLFAEVEFNRDVRPILSDRCYACHGPDKGNRKTKMRLDLEADAKAPLSGKRFAIVPGSPEKSEIYKRITSTNQAQRMPPAYLGHDKLRDDQIEIIRKWIEQGAKYQIHWSFIPPVKSALPAVPDKKWPRNDIDYFVLHGLEREGLKPSPEADKRTLIRRVTLDLTGLPPTPAEVEAFLADNSPDAYEKVVDRLLASTHYAERMAIRWLDAARYADTNGYQSDGPRTMWPWRDWVINAFQRDMPFDQFTIEQLAGDLLPNPTLSQQIATAFQRNHRTSAEGGIVDEEFRVDYVADRAETTSTVWLGLTVGCARCHDHKFDPITQKDYYSLFAFYNNVPERGFVWNFGNEDPVIKAPLPDQQKRLDELDSTVAGAKQKLQALQPGIAKGQQKWERKIAKQPSLDWTVTAGQQIYLPLDGQPEGKAEGCGQGPCSLATDPGKSGAALRFDGKTFLNAGKTDVKFDYRDPFTFTAWIKPDELKGAILSRGEDYLEGQQHGLYLMDGKLRLHVTFRWTDLAMRVETVKALQMGEWQHVAVTYDGGMKASGVRMYVNGEPQELKILFDQLLWPIDTKEPWRIGAGGGLRFKGAIDEVRVYNRALSAAEIAVVALLDPVGRIAAMPPDQRTPAQSDKLRYCYLERYAPAPVQQAQVNLAAAERARKNYYDAIPTVMVMKERETPRDAFILKRGAYDAHLDKVTPAVPAVLPPLPPGAPRNRLGLARWLVDRSNPLTARATVNRFWAMLFGIGLVKTVEDFGSQGEWPAHQELLDWLAVDFMDHGWSVKHVIRTMVMSATYRQSSKVTPELVQRDPENRLLARGPRVRLSAEMIRDQALAASGLLVDKVGGPPVKPYQPAGLWQELQDGQGYKEDEGEGLYRRSLYTYWRRTVAPPNMVNFDAPTRETCTVRENRTNTPLQALNLMNDVVYLEASRKLAERMIADGGTAAEQRIARGYELVLARSPKPAEQASLLRALERFRSYYSSNQKDAAAFLSQGKSPLRSDIQPQELAAYTAVASIIFNLDETITKE
jgi:hypothetical protein